MSAEDCKRGQSSTGRDEFTQRYARLTRSGIFNLMPHELFWQERHEHLKKHGYLLRPRYVPGWEPSWTSTGRSPILSEDSIKLIDSKVIDATRLSSQQLVAIKSFKVLGSKERDIACFFASIHDHRNHCVAVHEILSDPFDPQLALMVMPYLRPCNNPEFGTIGDIVEFVDQTIEGLGFMHEHRVAHRDIAVANVMMDAKALYPNGHHPVRLGFSTDGRAPVSAFPRAGRNVRYFYIDFGWSSRFAEGESTMVVGDVGRAYVPEITSPVPHDAFKVDIFALGDLYSQEFEQKFNNVDFLLSLIEAMTQKEPGRRPTAQEVAREWEKTRTTLNESLLRWRLVPKGEAPLERMVNDTVAVAWEGVYRLKQFVSP
ncbi:kinase-like domain-containing protein [Trametes gibbosa]|nr:kinase-like domain-containing protein [Trametes gibbosa]